MRPWYNYDQPRPQYRFSIGFGRSKTVYVLIGVTAGMYLLTLVLVRHFDVVHWLGFYGPFFVRGAVWQPITYMFLHGGMWHLFSNMIGLYFFGPAVEAALGRRAFLVMYFACGVFGAILQMIFEFQTAVIGASGGVLGVLIAFAVMNPQARIFLFPIPIPIRAMYLAIVWTFITVASVLAPQRADNTAHWAHLGGIVVGFLFVRYRHMGAALGRYWDARNDLRNARRVSRREQRSAAEQGEMDRILEKVHREGITKLTNAERDFLNRMSRKLRGR